MSPVRWAVISDIHANREALDAVLDSIEKSSIDSVICLGDIVGYGADPNYCVERVKSCTDAVVVGNHDHAAVGLTSIDYFNPYAKEAALWTMTKLTRQNSKYLKNLKFSFSKKNLLFVHSTPDRPEMWRYVFSLTEAQWQFDRFSEKICFIGHSHVPALYKKSGSDRRIINIGSVGQPRDRDPRAGYYIYDDEKDSGDWIRVTYDIDTAADKIRKAGLPDILAKRLYEGR